MTPRHPALDARRPYLDYNATTPVDPGVVDGITEYLRMEFGNPSSGHEYGRVAASGLGTARQRVLRLVNGAHGRVVFAGSGSEADALAIKGAVMSARDQVSTPHVITQATEHPAVLAACADLQQSGVR